MNISTNYTRKFFDDKEQTVPVTRRLYLQKSAEEVQACLKSEGVVIDDIDSLFKTLDIILRAVGIHREPEDADQVACMHSLVGIIKLGDTFANKEKAEQFKTLLDMFQSTVKSGWKYDDSDLKVIKDNIEIVSKELITYFNDIIDVLVREFDPQTCTYVNANFTSKDSDDAIFNIMLSYKPIVADFGLDILSTMVSDIGYDDMDHVNIISFTFNNDAVNAAKKNLRINDDEANKKEENNERTDHI